MRIKKLWDTIKREWPLELSATIFLGVAFLLLTYDLRGLVGGYSASELKVADITSSLPSLVENVVYYPYYAMVYLVRFVVSDGVYAARLTSAALGFVSVLSIFLLITRWFNSRVAIVGAAVFVSGSWFLQLARTGTPDILGIAALTTLWASSLWLINRPRKILPATITMFTLVLAWFVPFMPWLLIAVLTLAAFRERELLKIIPLWLWIVIGFIGAGILAGLAYSLINNTSDALMIFGVPDKVPTITEVLSSFKNTIASVFWAAPSNPERWLSTLPLLDIFGVVMVTLGVYHHERNFGNRRGLILFGSIGIVVFLLAFNGGIASPAFSLLLPLFALLIISGLYEFLSLWSSVFPRNPFAYLLAVSVLSVMVTMSSYYQLTRFFVAWPGAPETKQVYSDKIIQ